MSISNVIVRNDYVATGQSTFTYNFKVFIAADLIVLLNGATQILNVDYTLTGVGLDNGGTVVFTVAPAIGAAVAFIRKTTLGRTNDYQLGGAFTAVQANSELDRLWAVVIENQANFTRSIRLGDADSSASLVLPVAAIRASGVIGFDVNGNLVVTGYATPPGSLVLPVSVIQGGTGATSTTGARGNLGLGTAAVANTGTSGHALGYLDTANKLSAALNFAKGAAVPSATSCDIWTPGDGNLVHVTGTTTITSFATAPQAGASRVVVFDGALTLTNNANITLAGIGNITTAAGDMAIVVADTTTQCRVIYVKSGWPAGGGRIAQIVNSQTGAVATGTTQIPGDDTIPQNTEGDQYMTLSITPTNTNSTLLIDVGFNGMNSGGAGLLVALFQDSTANALGGIAAATASNQTLIFFRHKMTAGTTSSTTFKVRAGGNTAGTTTFNGTAGGRIFGGVMVSSITIIEVLP